MSRVLAVCALLSFGAAGVLGQTLPDSYAQKLKVVLDAENLVKKRLGGKQDYDLFKPLVHYLSLLGVAFYPAKELNTPGNNRSASETYSSSLVNNLPNVLLEPTKIRNEIKKMLSDTQKKLQPLSDLVDEVCEGQSDFECNKVVSRLVETGDYEDVKKSMLVLEHASAVASLLLSKDGRLQEVAASLDVVPYLVSNEFDVIELVKLFENLLLQIYPQK